MPDPARLMAMLARAKRSRLASWLVGLRGFSMVAPADSLPANPQDADPMRRLYVRVVTTLEGLIALAILLAGALVAALVWLAGSAFAAGWALLAGSATAEALALRSMWRSRRTRIPQPGAAVAAAVAAALLAAWAVLIATTHAKG